MWRFFVLFFFKRTVCVSMKRVCVWGGGLSTAPRMQVWIHMLHFQVHSHEHEHLMNKSIIPDQLFLFFLC